MRKQTIILVAIISTFAMLGAFSVRAQFPKPPNPPSPPSPQQLLNQFFGAVKDRIIAGADRINQWKTDAENALRKRANDFAGCPSNDAQRLYDDLKSKRQQAAAVKAAAEEADRQARENRENCKRTTGLNAQCDAAYNQLPFQGTIAAANATIASLDAALTALKNLKCVSGCNRAAKILYPYFEVGTTNIYQPIVGSVISTNGSIIANTSVSIVGRAPEIKVCTAWDPGQFNAQFDAGNGEFNASVNAKLPKCAQVETYKVCTDWDLTIILPELIRLKLVPPDVKVSDLIISVPNKDVRVITGVERATCSQPVTVCKRASGTINVDTGANPFSNQPTGGCLETVQIGCASPAFGMVPVYSTVSIPDITRVKISWKGIRIKGGSITVDMTRPEFKATCKGSNIPAPPFPKVTVRTGSVNVNWACLEPRWTNLVANQ